MLRVGLILNILTLIWQLDIFTLIIGLPWCWERLRAGGEGDDRGWDGWMASPTQWTWIWVDSGSWWWTGRPGVLWFMGPKESDTTEWLNWTELIAQLVKNPPAMQETPGLITGQEDPLEKGQSMHCSLQGFLCGSAGKESTCNVWDLSSILGLGKSGEGKGYPLQ